MRSRGRFRTRRSRRDAEGPVSYRAVPLARFRREVVALLMAGRSGSSRLDSTQALRLVIRWDRMVRLRHGQGKPPCNVADHILKYEKQGAVCPCGNALPSPLQGARDKDRGACRRCSRDPSRWSRLKGWRDRKMVSRREDFEGMTHNVGEVTSAAARGQMPDFRKLRAVKNPISRLVERDPKRHNHDPHKRLMWCPNTRCITAQPGWTEKGQTKCEWCKGTLRPVKGGCKACDEEARRG